MITGANFLREEMGSVSAVHCVAKELGLGL